MSELLALYNQLRGHEDITFIALKGKSNADSTFTIHATYAQLIETFKPVPFDAKSPLFIQRETQVSRINNLVNYLPNEHASLPATGAIVEKFNAKHLSGDFYEITIKANSFRYFFDGQARLGSISKHIEKHKDARDNTLVIMLFESLGTKLDNQRFADWNCASTRPNQSIVMAMDSRMTINSYTKEIVNSIPALCNRIDYMKASVTNSGTSDKIWSLNQFKSFVQNVTGATPKTAEKLFGDDKNKAKWVGFIAKFFDMLCTHPQIGNALNPNTPASTTRNNTIIGTSVFLKSIGLTGRIVSAFLQSKMEVKADWSFIEGLKSIDFSKDNPEWMGRCMNFRGGFEDKKFNHMAVAQYLLSAMNIPLPEELIYMEEQVLMQKAAQLKSKREQSQKEAQTELLLDVDQEVKAA